MGSISLKQLLRLCHKNFNCIDGIQVPQSDCLQSSPADDGLLLPQPRIKVSDKKPSSVSKAGAGSPRLTPFQITSSNWRPSKPSLKIRTVIAIFWISLDIFRDCDLIYFLRNKSFLFFKIES